MEIVENLIQIGKSNPLALCLIASVLTSAGCYLSIRKMSSLQMSQRSEGPVNIENVDKVINVSNLHLSQAAPNQEGFYRAIESVLRGDSDDQE